MSQLEDSSEVRIPVDEGVLPGRLNLPPEPSGVVLFAHGSGSSRFSPRNRMVARRLEQGGLATLLFDLLNEAEADRDALTAEHRFDIPLLGRRLTTAVDWVANRHRLERLPIGLFGASTGAAAALVTAADRPSTVGAVVSRGGRPDLAGDALLRVHVPTLLIVGGRDREVIRLNESAAARMPAAPEITIVKGASHLFEETGKLDEVAELATGWFQRYLSITPDAGYPVQ